MCTIPYRYDNEYFNQNIYHVNGVTSEIFEREPHAVVCHINVMIDGHTNYAKRGLYFFKRGKVKLYADQVDNVDYILEVNMFI